MTISSSFGHAAVGGVLKVTLSSLFSTAERSKHQCTCTSAPRQAVGGVLEGPPGLGQHIAVWKWTDHLLVAQTLEIGFTLSIILNVESKLQLCQQFSQHFCLELGHILGSDEEPILLIWHNSHFLLPDSTQVDLCLCFMDLWAAFDFCTFMSVIQIHRGGDPTESEHIQTNADGQGRRHHPRRLPHAAGVSTPLIRFRFTSVSAKAAEQERLCLRGRFCFYWLTCHCPLSDLWKGADIKSPVLVGSNWVFSSTFQPRLKDIKTTRQDLSKMPHENTARQQKIDFLLNR